MFDIYVVILNLDGDITRKIVLDIYCPTFSIGEKSRKMILIKFQLYYGILKLLQNTL